jgi:arylsulfatase A-like enzyme
MFKVHAGPTLVLGLLVLVQPLSAAGPSPDQVPAKPNVLIFMLDDVGFAQLGSFGGAAETPNMDRIAGLGVRYTNFHTTALCSPSRAALLTGRNHHSVGAGVVVELQTDEPGYTSHIPKDKWSLVESLRQNGYATAAFGKWHNTPVDQIRPEGPFDLWPMGLGFERFYGFMAGDASQWEPLVWDNKKPLTPHTGRPDYHFTTDMTDKAIAWLQQETTKNSDKPFFMYYATGAMHAPHHAPQSYIDKYKGRFDQGWDRVREETLTRQKLAGIVPQNTQLSPRPKDIKAWDELSADEKRLYSRMQETFAGYLDHTDHEFGRLLAALEKSGKMDNTIIIITSDNGASGEGGLEGSYNESRIFNALPENFEQNLAHINDLGSRTAYNHYPAGWAMAGNTPLQYFKQTTNEGGVRDPFIIAWPHHIEDQGAIRWQFTHMIDVLPTILDVAQVPVLAKVNDVEQAPVQGASFAASLTNPEAPDARDLQYFEMLGNRAVWQDGWKAVAFHGRFPWDVGSNPDFAADPWNLYRLDDDVAEMNDLAQQYPEKLAELKALFDGEARKNNVYPLNDTTASRVMKTYESFTAGKTSFSYGQTDGHIHEALSPPVKNRSHVITATLTQVSDGVIVAAGGRFGGYTLFVKDNRLYYTHNFVGEDRYEIMASETLPNGPVDVRFDFEKTGNNQGTGRLYMNGILVGEREIPQTTPALYSQYDTFDIGEDSGAPVSDRYESPFTYKGVIQKVDFQLGPQ